MLRAIQNNPLFRYLFTLVLSLVLWGQALFETGFADWHIWVSWALVTGSSLAFGFIITKHRLSRSNTGGLYSVLFLCLASVHAGRNLETALWLYPMALLVLHFVLSIYGKDRSYPAIFNTAFFWTALTVFEPGLFLTLPCIFIILLAYSLNNWREWVCAFFGIAAAYIILLAVYFLTDRMSALPARQEIFPFGFLDWEADLPLMLSVVGLSTVFSFISILSLRSYLQDLEISERQKSSALACMLVYFTLFFIFTRVEFGSRFFFYLPLAFFAGKFLQKQGRGPVKEIFFDILLVLTVLQAIL